MCASTASESRGACGPARLGTCPEAVEIVQPREHVFSEEALSPVIDALCERFLGWPDVLAFWGRSEGETRSG